MTATAKPLFAIALLVSWYHPRVVGAQERFPRVQYVAGRPELAKPTEVTLVLNDLELRAEHTVYSDRGSSVRTAFTIPLANIIAVGASPRDEAAGLVLTGPFGVASSLNHAQDRIEAVVFKMGRQQSAGLAAKIESAAEKALEAPSSRPAKARRVRSNHRPLRLVSVVARTATPPRDGFRKSRGRSRWRSAADHRHVERT